MSVSEEDLALRDLTEEELVAYWNQWHEQAQATNAADEDTYSHGVFTTLRTNPFWPEPSVPLAAISGPWTSDRRHFGSLYGKTVEGVLIVSSIMLADLS